MHQTEDPKTQAWVLGRAATLLIGLAEKIRGGSAGPHELNLLDRILEEGAKVRAALEEMLGIRGTPEELRQIMIQSPKKLQAALALVLRDEYEGFTHLGRGGMGIVFGAKNKGIGRMEALKCLFEGHSLLGQELFKTEAQLTARVPHHPNVVGLHRIREVTIEIDKKRYTIPLLVLEYIEGAKDGKALFPCLPTHVSITLAFLSHIAEGLSAAHDHDIAHRDMKPSNVLILKKTMEHLMSWYENTQAEKGTVDLTPEVVVKALLNTKGGVKIADFGLASSGEKSEEEGSPGTAQYMPPEAYDPGADGKAWDVYALALTMYAFLTGKENPLQHSIGLDDKKWERGSKTEFCAGFAKALSGIQKPNSAISPNDPELKALLSRDRYAGPIVDLLVNMSSFDPKKRPSIDVVKMILRKELEARSPAAKKLRRLQRVKRRAVQAIGCLAIGLLGLLAAIPIKERRERRHHTIEEHQHAIESAKEFAERKEWANLLNLIRAALHHLLEKSVLSDEETNQLGKELKQWNAYAEAMRQAEEFEKQGKPAEAEKMRKTARLLEPR